MSPTCSSSAPCTCWRDGGPSVLRSLTGRLLDAAHVRFKVVAKTRQEATAAALVAAGVGCTLAPKSWLRPGLRAVKVEGLSLERTVGLMWETKANEGRAAGIAKNLEASMTSDTLIAKQA